MEAPMSPPLFLVDGLPESQTYRLDGPEGHHAATVARLRVGEALMLADGCGGTAAAVVAAAGRGTLDITVTSRWYAAPPQPRITVVQAIAKGERGELAVQMLTELGTDEIVPWSASRSVARWRDDGPPRRWSATAREAAKQARRPWLPEVAPPATTADVADRIRAASHALVLHESAEPKLSAVELSEVGTILLVVGPEGGVAPEELAEFEAAGARPVRLGEEILRTSTAGVAAVAALSVRLQRW
jgi:16S rRNA (uracil1498-N3)-methyltransferase